MAIYKMIEKEHPILKMKLSLSEDIDRHEVVEDLVETMRSENGIGLSANQVGLLERVFVMYSDVKEKKIMACFDPQIVEMASEQIIMDEGCLTYPGMWLKIKRPVWIKATWEDQDGVKDEYQLAGLEARVFQHEYDHMEGTDFTKKVSKLKLKMAKKRVQKQLKKVNRINDLA
jgi:peptide deformylase